jgi:hypothetical protein
LPAPWQPRIGEQATDDREQDGERDARRVPTSYDEEHGWVASRVTPQTTMNWAFLLTAKQDTVKTGNDEFDVSGEQTSRICLPKSIHK